MQIKRLFRLRALSIVTLLLIAALNQPAFASGDSTKIQLEKKLASEKQTEIIVQYKKTLLFQEKKFSNSIDSRIKEREGMGNGLEIIRAKDTGQVSGLLEELRKNNDILYAEKNKLLSINERPNDPFYENQWGLGAIMAESAWDMLLPYQARVVTVGIIDTGIEKTHPDLASRIAPGGYNFILNSSDVYDINGHGTGVAGVIAAETGNGAGIAGVTGRLNVKILPLQAASYKGYAYVSDVIKAIDYAIEKGVDVLNLSMGSSSFSDIENEAIQRAVQSGIVVVASAGNEGTQEFSYPASFDNVISVGSVAKDITISSFSNHNDRVDLVAPGEDIYTTGLDNSYSSYYGTSFAAPMVAGIASAIKATDPTLTPAEIASIIKDTTADKGAPG
ncbi:MAG: S8 family serine peptidase [Firmicutes bacterium]|nr:S8 family serine peptidase [Bacillota bacterium]